MRVLSLLPALLLAACAVQPARQEKPPAPPPPPPSACPATPAPPPAACNCGPGDTLPSLPKAPRQVPPPPPEKTEEPAQAIRPYQQLRPAAWSDLEGYAEDDIVAAWDALRISCSTLGKRDTWKSACEAVAQPASLTSPALRELLQTHFVPYQVSNPDGTTSGLITGYYEPLLKGSRTPTERYRYPLYGRPDDLITVDLGGLYPDLANRRIRGRLVGQKLVPYLSRGDIEAASPPLAGKELLWVDDIIDLFFLQIQGSGYIQLDSGEGVHVGYADQNGHPYQSIGRLLIEQGELTADQASMQGIKDWARANPDKLRALLNANPSYVFFRELPPGLSGPLGALGVPITAERSIAVDPRYIPLGAPVFLSTTYPNSDRPLRRLMLAQDTGGAIKGAVRADFFWGAGMEAGRQAGAMKQQGRMWVLLPRDLIVNGAAQ